MHVVILGGYGNAGWALARLLAEHTDAVITLLGRDGSKADEAARALAHETGRDVRSGQADAARPETLTSFLEAADVVVMASSTAAHVPGVAEAALATQTDYLDALLSSEEKWDALRRLEPNIKAQGRCFITDGGLHPGVPGALVRYAAQRLRDLEHAVVGGAFRLDWSRRAFSHETKAEFVAELKAFDPSVFVDGKWVRSLWRTRPFDFGPPFGRTSCAPMNLEEMRRLPEAIPTLRETGFYVAGFGPVIDYVVMPLCFAWLALAPRHTERVGAFFAWALNRFGGTENGAVLVLDAHGQTAAGPARLHLRLAHEDAYVFTAAPVVACLLHYADAPTPGLWPQAHFVDPVRFLDDLRTMGVTVEEGSQAS